MVRTIEIERDGAVAAVWLHRPKVHNAFDEALIGELDDALAGLDADAAVRVVVLGGRGRNFCAGADLQWMARAAASGEEENLRDARRFAAMLRRLATLRKPTLARVQGLALGGGVGLAAACDICLVGEDASFAMTEARLGLIPAVIAPYVLRAIGARQALRYMQSAERIGAARAVELGLAHEAVGTHELDERVARLSRDLLAGGPVAQAASKSLLQALAAAATPEAIVETTARAIAAQRSSAEARAGMEAFFAKRPPPWAPVR